MQLVSSPRQTARGPAATWTLAAQGAGYKNLPKLAKKATEGGGGKHPQTSPKIQKIEKMAKNGPTELRVLALKIVKMH